MEARREENKNTSSSFADETMKLIGTYSYGYQIIDQSKHSKTQYRVGAEVDQLVNERNFKNLNLLPSYIYEVEIVKSKVNHKEPIIVGFLILRYAKLTTLQLFYVFQLFCDPQKYELIEMDTDSPYMGLTESKVEESLAQRRNKSERLIERMTVEMTLKPMNSTIFSPETVVSSTGNLIRGHLDFSNNLDVLRRLLFVLKLTAAWMNRRE